MSSALAYSIALDLLQPQATAWRAVATQHPDSADVAATLERICAGLQQRRAEEWAAMPADAPEHPQPRQRASK